MTVRVLQGDCQAVLPQLMGEGYRAHACVTDPPYGIEFMGAAWDGADNVAFRPETWRRVRACLKPGAYLVAFGGPRAAHRMTCAIEDAGFEIRDVLAWLYGSGFPKSLDISKAIDKAAGLKREVLSITEPATDAARQWQGYGTALKPSYEPIILARVPTERTVAGNVLAHGCGGLNIDACRITTDDNRARMNGARTEGTSFVVQKAAAFIDPGGDGRWPANVVHDGSDEVEAAFAQFGESKSTGGKGAASQKTVLAGHVYGSYSGATLGRNAGGLGDAGSASRFFYSAKADAADRAGSNHPTVKPTDLMRWLVQLVCPPGGQVLDPFAGSGSTGLAADQLGMHATLIEQDAAYAADIRRKIGGDAGLFASLL